MPYAAFDPARFRACTAPDSDKTANADGFYCAQCTAQVFDFTGLTAHEIARWQVHRDAPACGIYHPAHFASPRVRAAPMPWYRRLPALLGFLPAAASLAQPAPRETAPPETIALPVLAPSATTLPVVAPASAPSDTVRVRGRLLAPNGTGVAGYAVFLEGTNIGTMTDSSGSFVLALPPEAPRPYVLRVSSLVAGDPNRRLVLDDLPDASTLAADGTYRQREIEIIARPSLHGEHLTVTGSVYAESGNEKGCAAPPSSRTRLRTDYEAFERARGGIPTVLHFGLERFLRFFYLSNTP